MKETTLLNNISKLVNKINYESVYVEIKTKNDKYIFIFDIRRNKVNNKYLKEQLSKFNENLLEAFKNKEEKNCNRE